MAGKGTETTMINFENDEIGVIITDSEHRITNVNSGFTKITGYSLGESLGKTCDFLQGEDTNEDAIKAIREALSHEKKCRVAILNYTKEHKPFWNLLTVLPIKGKDGRVTNYVGIQMCQQEVNVDSLPFPVLKTEGEPPSPPSPLSPSSPALPSSPTSPASSDASESPIRPRIEEEKKSQFSRSVMLRRDDAEGVVKKAVQIIRKRKRAPVEIREEKIEASKSIVFVGQTLLPTRMGHYRVRAYRDTSKVTKEFEIMCIIWGNVEDQADVPCRVHDQCFTSEVLGSLKCDCREQLEWAMEYVKDGTRNSAGYGLIIYLPQEGRGIGLANKIKAYSMQELGFDTVDANRVLGLEDDLRDYSSVPFILQDLGISSISLMSNNPRKRRHMEQLGVRVTGRIPVIIPSNPHSENYISVKQSRMGHHKS